MKSVIIAVAMTLCVVSLGTIASGDTLILRDGTRVPGTVTGIAGRTITFRHADGASRRYPTSQVASLEFFSADRTNPRATAGRRIHAPAGTELVVRTVETIDSRSSDADRSFSAIVEYAVSDGFGRVIIPEGASAQLVIRHLSSGGRSGRPQLVLDVQSLTVDGRRYVVGTSDLTEDSDTGIGTIPRTAETVGGGAAVATLIGTIAGGGQGEAIGGLIGPAGGTATHVLTKGREVRVPAEIVLRFRLDTSVTLRAEQ